MNVSGVVIIELDSDSEPIDGSPPIPAGVRVRVLIGDTPYVPVPDCQAIAGRVYGASAVEIEGSDPSGIRSLVDYLRADQRMSVT